MVPHRDDAPIEYRAMASEAGTFACQYAREIRAREKARRIFGPDIDARQWWADFEEVE